MQLKEQRVRRRFVQLLLEDHSFYQDDWPWGGELIYRNGKFCGYTTSTAYGFSLDKQVCLGFVHNFDEKTSERLPLTIEYLTKNANYEIDIAGKRYKAKINLYPPNLNLK
jgi:pyruvate dehydrogenase phosphatase regulatory subunit